MHPLPAVAWAAAGSFWGMLRKHGPKRKTDRASSAQPLTSFLNACEAWWARGPSAAHRQSKRFSEETFSQPVSLGR